MTDQYRQDDPRHVHDYQPYTTPDGTQLQVCNGLNCEAKHEAESKTDYKRRALIQEASATQTENHKTEEDGFCSCGELPEDVLKAKEAALDAILNTNSDSTKP